MISELHFCIKYAAAGCFRKASDASSTSNHEAFSYQSNACELPNMKSASLCSSPFLLPLPVGRVHENCPTCDTSCFVGFKSRVLEVKVREMDVEALYLCQVTCHPSFLCWCEHVRIALTVMLTCFAVCVCSLCVQASSHQQHSL